MNKKIVLVIFLVFISTILPKPKGNNNELTSRQKKQLLGKSLVIKQEPYSPEELYQLKDLYEFGNQSALDVLIKIYQRRR